jgi:hypothetical protein
MLTPTLKDLSRLALTLIRAGRSSEKAIEDIRQAYMLTPEEITKLVKALKLINE